MSTTMPTAADLLGRRKRILITGGAGFIGGAVVRRLLSESDATVFNLDKMGYASDLTSITRTLTTLGARATQRHQLLKVDLSNAEAVRQAVRAADPDLVMHLAAESHVDRSISGPGVFVESNVLGTFNLLQATLEHYENLDGLRKDDFRMHHISTDEVFGSLGVEGRFSETTPYDPRSPYSPSKAASDHLVQAWHHTYNLPVVLTNCSNNYGPWQFPEKLIPVVILKASSGEEIPLYGDGLNIRDWLFVEDHVDALLMAACRGLNGRSYCVGGHGEKTNRDIVETICRQLDQLEHVNRSHLELIKYVSDRPGHDRRYAIDPTRINKELGWTPLHNINDGLEATVSWYLKNQDWCKSVCKNARHDGRRLGSP